MQTVEVAIKPVVKIILKSDTEILDEVVVTGYGTFKKSTFTGAASTMEAEIASKVEYTNTVAAAAAVGEAVAKKAIEKGITEVVFDRGGFVYQGKVQALAEAAREAGLKF